jgi:hypothetical protein
MLPGGVCRDLADNGAILDIDLDLRGLMSFTTRPFGDCSILF